MDGDAEGEEELSPKKKVQNNLYSLLDSTNNDASIAN